jgi:hypothetical protein
MTYDDTPAGRPAGTERELAPHETELVGCWLDVGSRIEGDAVAARIEWLVDASLLHVAATAHGALYRDLRDGRWWELTHPHPHPERRGPPRLAALAPGEAAARYGVRER